MEINIKRKLQSKESKPNRPPKVIVIILALIFILAGINIINVLSTESGLKPFGFLEKIIAVGQDIAQNNTSLSLAESAENLSIKDNTDRCIPINSKTGAAMAEGTSMYVGKGGINQGTLVGGGGEEVKFIKGESDNNNINLEMGYILRLALGPQDIGATETFIRDSNDSGLIPIVRLCYSPDAGGICGFDMNVANDHPNSIAKFYRDIYNNLGGNFEAVFVTGPNEPGTAREMTNFKIANWDYATLVARTNFIASGIQDLRGGGITLAPAIFNTSNDIGGRYPTGGDFEAYNSNGIDWSLFDNILINMYDTKTNDSFEEYKNTGVQSFANDNGLKVIVTEFGLFDKDTEGVKDKFINNFKSLCSESSVDGILFFRSIEELGRVDGPNADTLPVSDIASMTKACVKLRDWLNCNFDSAIYPDDPKKVSLVPDSMSSASPSCTTRETPTSKGAALLVKCEGESCSAKMVKTIKATLPVKFFGSNSSFGTKTKQYTPISAEIAGITDSAQYDAMNQFAGELAGNDGSRYAMPLLGSGINSSSELSKFLGDFAKDNIQSYSSPGSFSSNALDEIKTEITRKIGGLTSFSKGASYKVNGETYIPDERVVNVNTNNFDKTDSNTLKAIRTYDPYTASDFSKLPESCTVGMKYQNNPDDYIPGPEVVVEEKTVWSGSGGELCRLYGQRNNGGAKEVDLQTSSSLNCSVNPTRRVPIAGGTALVNCRSVVFCNFNGGRCNINQAYSSCIDYQPASSDQVFIYSKDYATIPTYKIKDVWDALYTQYTMLQNALATRGLKMVFQENIGWKAEYQSTIRDANKTTDAAGTYLYSSTPEELSFEQGEVSGTAFEPKLFGNNSIQAKGQSKLTSEQYYDWLGYLDIIQEMRMIYLNSTGLDAETTIDNPYYQSTTTGPNSSREQIKLSGKASQLSNFPVLTCDQVELCKQKDILISDFGEEKANSLCPFTQLPDSSKLTCITEISDNRFDNGLQKQLCLRGYLKDSTVCKSYQCLPGETPIDGGIQGPNAINVTDGIVSLNLDLNKYDFIASNPNDSIKSIDTFANENSVDFAINTNFFSFGTEDPTAPEGLVAGKNTVEFNPTRRGIEAAIVFHNGNPTGGNSQIQVLAQTDKLALIEVDGTWGGNANEKLASVSNNLTISISGLPILIQNGVRADTTINYQGISNNFSPRTIIGWNAAGELVMVVVKSADFQGMVNAASQLGLINAIGMDGGGSSQIYSRNGFPSDLDPSTLKVDNTVYWPGRANENGPRNVIAYLGARPKTGSVDFNNQQGVNSSTGNQQTGSPTIDISLIYPNTNTKVINNGEYGCAVRRGSEDNEQCHTGLDFPNDVGSPVVAAAAGTVIYATQDPEGGAYGISIRISHPGGASTLYAHLSGVAVQAGQEVSQGELIGYVGNTGNSTGPHLHFELRKNDTCLWDGLPSIIGRCSIDPTPYLTGKPSPIQIPRCLVEPDFNTPAIPGVLNCTIDMKTTTNNVDWAGSTDYLNVYIKAYNLDDNQSFTWIGSREMTSDAHPESREDRIKVTDFVIQKSIELGLSPKFVINLWLEETAGSAVGTKALGCGVYIDSYSSIPYRQGADAMIRHMSEQIDCLSAVINKTSNFVEFMCTYSGEKPAPGTSMKPGSVRTCNQFTNNANFPVNICKIYAQL